MRGLARWIGAPGMAAMLAVPLIWTSAPPRPGHHHRHPASLAVSHRVSQTPVPHTVAGRWSFLLGDFEFAKTGVPGTFTDRVIDQRLGVFCPKVNDRDGQIVLRGKKDDWRVYTGTWQWFYPSSCKFAGYGRITVTLWQTRPYAYVTAYPPKGIRNAPDTFLIERIS